MVNYVVVLYMVCYNMVNYVVVWYGMVCKWYAMVNYVVVYWYTIMVNYVVVLTKGLRSKRRVSAYFLR
jgi:hypothetical protein